MVTGFWSSNVKRALDDFKEEEERKQSCKRAKIKI